MRPITYQRAMLAAACVFLLASSPSQAQPSADEVLDCAIRFHDPQGQWDSGTFALKLDEQRPDGSGRHTALRFDNAAPRFDMDSRTYSAAKPDEQSSPSRRVEVTVLNEEPAVKLNGSSKISAEDAERYRLTPERAKFMRNYYLYLYGLPMKLRDPGTTIDPTVQLKTWQDQKAHELKVTYNPEVGTDLWYFYFSTKDCALIGYRFHRSPEENDGENIYLEGLAEVDGLRLPRHRTWYTVAENKLLGTDSIVDGD